MQVEGGGGRRERKSGGRRERRRKRESKSGANRERECGSGGHEHERGHGGGRGHERGRVSGERSSGEPGGGGRAIVEPDDGCRKFSAWDPEIEAQLFAEKAWDRQKAWAQLQLDQDSLSTDLDGNNGDSDSGSMGAGHLHGSADEHGNAEDDGYAVNSMPVQDCSRRLNRLMGMQKTVLTTNQARKRKRSTSAANASNIEQSASSPSPICPVQKRRKRVSTKKSLVWRYFTTGLRGQDPIATCKHCGQIYSCDRSTHGTSTLWYHLRNLCPEDPLKGQDIQKKNPGTPKQPFTIEDCRKALADMVIIDEMPFKAVEGVGFKRYSKVLQPRFELPSRVTVARDCWQRYIEEKPKLKKVLASQRICLTTDTWASNNGWKLQKRILNYCSVADQKGVTLGKRVEECLLEWGIDRLFTIAVDNASSNDRLILYLKGVCKNWEGVVLNNKFLHVRCCTHIVNLVVKSGLEEHNVSIEKIRTAVRFVRSSPSRFKVFKKCAELEKISCKRPLTLDLETRWNATYLMLENAEKFEKAFACMEKDYKPYKVHFGDQDPPNASDWEASSIVFHDIMLMHAKLNEIANGEDMVLASMAYNMKLKFQKYWEEEGNLNLLLFIAVILDPRYKLKYLEFFLAILYEPDMAKNLAEKVQAALAELFASYAETVSASSNRGSNEVPLHINVDEQDEENPWDLLASQFEQHMEAIGAEENDLELSRYLDEKLEKRDKDFDILNFWKVNSNRYPALSLLAKDVLAVPVSTVPSESTFSTGGRIIDPLRCSLSTSTVEALICTQSWLHTSHSKESVREVADDVQTYEDIREEFVSKDNTDRENHVDLAEFEA